MCGRMFLEEFDEVEKYVGGLPDMIQGSAPYRLAPSEMKELSDQLQELSNKCFIRPTVHEDFKDRKVGKTVHQRDYGKARRAMPITDESRYRLVSVVKYYSRCRLGKEWYEYEIALLKSKLEKISKEKNDIKTKIEKSKNASQSLDQLIGRQITDKSKRGLGYVSYNAVPSPHTGSIKISEPVKENNDVPLIEDWESKGEDEVESLLKIERRIVEPSVDKVEVDIPKQNDKPVGRPVKYAEMYRTQRPRGANTIRGKGCVTAPIKFQMYSVAQTLSTMHPYEESEGDNLLIALSISTNVPIPLGEN
nr:hypothetical protein [Tanacetum cinerariifolium]